MFTVKRKYFVLLQVMFIQICCECKEGSIYVDGDSTWAQCQESSEETDICFRKFGAPCHFRVSEYLACEFWHFP